MTPDDPDTSARHPAGSARARLDHLDRGTTYVELLISIVLMGTAVIAVLTAVRATTIATRIDAEQTRALPALLSAADELHGFDLTSCADPVAVYNTEIAEPSVLVTQVAFLDRPSADDDLTWDAGHPCDTSGTHRITLVYEVDGEAVATMETVRRG